MGPPESQDVDTVLGGVAGFLASGEFVVNFVANLGGAMGGVLLAFWIERFRVRRSARVLYGQFLRASRSELAYLQPMIAHGRDALRSGTSTGTLDYFAAPATRALLINPSVHDQAPYSLIMAVTILCHYFDTTENAVRDLSALKLTDPTARELLRKMLGDELDNATRMITIALEQIDSQLKGLRLEKTADAETQEVSRRLREVLVSKPPKETVPA